jgi:hypothetical protein
VPAQPATPERVLRGLQAKAAGTDGPRREGKAVIFDDDISVTTVAHESSLFRELASAG